MPRKTTSLAERADRHDLYERSVQNPPGDAKLFARFFRKLRGYEAMHLREDFCGTAALCLAWVRSRRGRTAVGIDICQQTLDWGWNHRISSHGSHVTDRIQLICEDVRDEHLTNADIACALNFSYYCFKTRAELLRYFCSVYAGLAEHGIFILDVLGGAEAMDKGSNEQDHGDFIYRWEQARFNIINHELFCYIHFHFPDGSQLPRAFSYDWRLWTLPELQELLREAGFRKIHVYWEKTDQQGDGLGVFFEPNFIANQQLWWTYVVAEKQ